MSDLQDLYHQVIIDHSKRPRNFRTLEGGNHAQGYNPLCGDRVTIYLTLENDVVTDISFQGTGCAISTASASLLTETLKGKTRAQVEAMFKRFHELVTEGEKAQAADAPELGKLAVFSGVSNYPARVKCASLAWHTLRAALAATNKVVTTE